MEVTRTKFERDRHWSEYFYGPDHVSHEAGDSIRITCAPGEVPAAMRDLAREGFTVTGCAPDMQGGTLIMAERRVQPN